MDFMEIIGFSILDENEINLGTLEQSRKQDA